MANGTIYLIGHVVSQNPKDVFVTQMVVLPLLKDVYFKKSADSFDSGNPKLDN
jgi:hypothetical protein